MLGILQQRWIWTFLPTGVWPPKFDWAVKKSKFKFVVEYPTWVSINRYLTGKLALDGQNLISCFRFEENVQKPYKKTYSWKSAHFDGFWMIYPYGDFGFFIRLWRCDRGSNTLVLSTDIVYFGETWIFDFIRGLNIFTEFMGGQNGLEIKKRKFLTLIYASNPKFPK